jgi:hypothetical protein
MTDLSLPLGQLRIPHFPVPDGETVESWLRRNASAASSGATERSRRSSSSASTTSSA